MVTNSKTRHRSQLTYQPESLQTKDQRSFLSSQALRPQQCPVQLIRLKWAWDDPLVFHLDQNYRWALQRGIPQ